MENSLVATSQQRTYDVLIVGAGPAGMMAAEHTALAGLKVAVADAMPSPARKFLMAGKSGLNLTKDEDTAAFIKNYDAIEPLRPIAGRVRPHRGDHLCAGLGPRGLHRQHWTGVSQSDESFSTAARMVGAFGKLGCHAFAPASMGGATRGR